jgi:integrase
MTGRRAAEGTASMTNAFDAGEAALDVMLTAASCAPARPGDGGGAMDGSALYRRYKLAQAAATVRALRFHDLRHTFGTQAIAEVSVGHGLSGGPDSAILSMMPPQ